jgi:hypothetical protein
MQDSLLCTLDESVRKYLKAGFLQWIKNYQQQDLFYLIIFSRQGYSTVVPGLAQVSLYKKITTARHESLCIKHSEENHAIVYRP